MTKEIIWNLSLLIFGIFLVLAFTINFQVPRVIPGWHSNSLFPPFGFESKIKLGIALGVILILFRYVNIGILSIANKDLRLLVLLIGYSIPILILLIGIHFSLNDMMNNFYQQMFPIQHIKEKISDLREAGMFKSYSEKSDEFVTELAIGRAISKQGGWTNSGQYWNTESKKVNELEILRLDTDKVWQEEDTEFIYRGNRAYEEVIRELGQISEGNFNPTKIEEEWETREKVKLTFEDREKKHTFYPEVVRDWADMDGILKYVNNEILDTIDYKFYYGRGGDILIIGLTEDERKNLSKIDGITFREIK